jgi:hypothetical protein
MIMPKRNRQNDPYESEEYKKLVADLKVIIDDARAKGIDLTQRMDVLTCGTCDSYEEITGRGDRIVVDPMHRTAALQQFLIIDSVQKSLQRKKVRYFKTTYTFICSSCGAYQTAVIRDRFDI